MNETETLGRYIATSKPEEIPAGVRHQAKLLVLDQIGCQIAGGEMPWSAKIYDAIQPLSAPARSTVVCRQPRLAPDAAAFLNSAFGHSNESDDIHLKTPTHPGAVIVPAALAAAEDVGAPGRDLLAAVVTAYEVMLRVSYAVSPYLIARGHHPAPAVGPFGAAAAAARLYGLNVDETVNALAIAGSHAAGLLEYTQTGGSVKRLHCAIPAQAGVRSALLARSGVTGPPTVLEGTRGFCRVFAPEADLAWLTRDLGARFLLPETSIKSYSCCAMIHPALDALQQLWSEHHPFTAQEVERVLVFTRSPPVVSHVGAIKAPPDILAAQFSMAFSIAMYLSGWRCDWHDYCRVPLQDRDLLNLSRRVDVLLEDPERAAFVTGLRIVVKLAGGAEMETVVEHARGDPENPLSDEEIRKKFRSLVAPVISEGRVADLVSSIGSLEEVPDVTVVGAALRG